MAAEGQDRERRMTVDKYQVLSLGDENVLKLYEIQLCKYSNALRFSESFLHFITGGKKGKHFI